MFFPTILQEKMRAGDSLLCLTVWEPSPPPRSLHRKIETITRLKMSQQRLIYRGWLISSGCIASTNASTSTNEAAAAVVPSSISAGMWLAHLSSSVHCSYMYLYWDSFCLIQFYIQNWLLKMMLLLHTTEEMRTTTINSSTSIV